ncbi:MAG: phosphatase PAP2 family protein [Thermoanaerobaculia bacterium]
MHFEEADETGIAGGLAVRCQEAASDVFERLDASEVEIVIRVADAARASGAAPVAAIVTRLGNGWIYPILAFALFATGRIERPLIFVVLAGTNLGIAFLAYPLFKHALGRLRPCDYEPSLARHGEPLDRYSCPSGHTMTAASFGVTVAVAWPPGIPLALAFCLLMGWSRVALGHHYPTDVILGGAIGFAIAAPVAALVY